MSGRGYAAPALGHQARRYPMRLTVGLAVGTALLAVAGCAGAPRPASAGAAAPARSAQRWQQCMRAHEVTVPSAAPGPGPAGAPSPGTGGQPPSPPGTPPSAPGQGSPG